MLLILDCYEEMGSPGSSPSITPFIFDNKTDFESFIDQWNKSNEQQMCIRKGENNWQSKTHQYYLDIFELETNKLPRWMKNS